MHESDTSYEHTQQGGLAFHATVFSMVCMAGFFAIPILRILRAEQLEPVALWSLVGVALLSEILLLCAVLMLHSLTVRIEGQTLHVRFGPGMFRKRFDLAQVTACRPVRNSWLHGWGIHWMAGTWVYNIAGFDAVEIEMRSGKKVRIGTDEPEALAAAITSHITSAE